MTQQLRETTGNEPTVAMPLEELRGRAVWSEDGERVGTIRAFHVDDTGRILSLHVRRGWFSGEQWDVDASDMRFEAGDVVVPRGALTPHAGSRLDSSARHEHTATPAATPVLLSGRSGARDRFGGLDPMAALIGALVAIGSFVLIAPFLVAAFDTSVLRIDSGNASWSTLGGLAAIIGAVSLALSFLLGGWAAGRAARFDGAPNGALVTAWVVVLGLVSAGLGALIGSRYDVMSRGQLPNIDWSSAALAGIVGVLIALGIMLVAGALGGSIGALRNRRVDRSMFHVVDTGMGRTDAGSDVGRLDTPADDRTSGVGGTPTGNPVAPRPMSTTDSADDVTRPR